MSGNFGEDRDEGEAGPNPIDVHVGQQIRQRRATLGMTQEQLATMLGVSFQQVQKYERGVNRVGASRLHDLMTALDVPVGYFFRDAPAGPPGSPAAAPGVRETQPSLGDDIFSRRETIDLVRAFSRITDPGVRQHVLDLVRSLGAAGAP